MIDVVVELVAEFFRHPTDGVNAIAQTLPRDRIDSSDQDALPPFVPIYTDARNKGVAESLTPPESPALIVFARFDDDEAVRNGYIGSKDVTIYASLATDDSADTLTTIRTRNAIYRAIRASLARFNDLDRASSTATGAKNYRELNDVQIDKIDRIREERVTEAVGSTRYWGLMEIHVWAIDGAALPVGVEG